MAKKVLIFTYYWPPGSGPGVQRWLKFTKFLPENNILPTVITVRDGSYPNTDENLVKDIHPDVRVIKTDSWDPFELYNRLQGKKGKSISVGLTGIKDSKSVFQRLAMFIRANFFIPDARKGWNNYAIKAGRALLKNQSFDAIITTGPPHSTHLIGLKLAKEFGVKWIVDFRDPWTKIYYNKMFPRSKRTEKKDARLEQTVLEKADRVITISPGLGEDLSYTGKKVDIVYNGFDPSDMDLSARDSGTNTGKFVLAYTGNFKPNQNCPELWVVLEKICKENSQFKKDLQIALTGNVHPQVLEDIKARGLGNNLELEGFVSHNEATTRMRAATALLFIIPRTDSNRYILTGKIFEYLASGTPIVAIGPPRGDAAKIISEAERGTMFDYSDTEAIEQLILDLYNHHRDGSLEKENTDAVFGFSRSEQTKKLVEVINTL
ncbi:glycosyltransferase family 4 protein [Luteibaculum oceani]|uniref:Glycosyltransferase family 4 protein n=1 Tax=Luteibaculum oceani TaxID=1294296 RepID=A0A5C6V8X7_9FLAO|nr:glycosyltransferase family 4 protein [Luteibaculum oceani]TXC81537.1 glycosyltransferase family 4 protein [Luteibaculum oceani]